MATPWIPIEITIREHDKIYNLAEKLCITNAHAVGLMVCLWSWAATVAVDGDITDFPPKAIAQAAGWTKGVNPFIEAITDKKSLFVEEVDGRLMFRNWEQRNGMYIESISRQREQTKQRVQRYRERKQNNGVTPCNGYSNVTNENSNACTVPNLTVPKIYSDGGDDAQECAKTDQSIIGDEETEETIVSILETANQHKATMQEIDNLPADIKLRFMSLCTELFNTYFAQDLTEFDVTVMYRMIRKLKWKSGEAIPPLTIGADETELMANAFEAAAKANAKNLSYVAGVLRRFRERGIQSADEFWAYEVKRDLDKDKKLAGRTG